MIAAVSWIPKGASASVPKKADPPSKEEMEEIMKHGALEMSGSEEDVETMDLGTDEVSQALAVAYALGRTPQIRHSTPKFDDVEGAMKELNMANYDDDDEGVQLFGSELGNLFYPSNDLDPHLKDGDASLSDGYDDDSEELEDLTIQPTDALIVSARNKHKLGLLEVWVYEDGDPNMFVHHHVVLSAFALCTAWLDLPLKGGEKGNFVAVGSMQSSIEIWDLDIVDGVQPTKVLGCNIEKTNEEFNGNVEGSHTDSVLGLAWNKDFRNALASASADKLVKIWDVATGICDITMEHHTDKVQSVAWNHHEPLLLSGSFDRSVVLKDVRRPKCPGLKWSVRADVESLAWDPHSSYSFVASLEDGTVQGFDTRVVKSDSKPSFTLRAHDEAVCSISYNPSVPNLLATGSTDKMVKLWDLSNNQPACIASYNPKAGGVFSVSFSGDNPFLLAIGGSNGQLKVWDTSLQAGVARRFGNLTAQT